VVLGSPEAQVLAYWLLHNLEVSLPYWVCHGYFQMLEQCQCHDAHTSKEEHLMANVDFLEAHSASGPAISAHFDWVLQVVAGKRHKLL